MKLRAVLTCLLLATATPLQAATPDAATLAQVDRTFGDWALSAHAPGLVYGIVADGKLVRINSFGAHDPGSQQPVTADSLFRIASMSKAFTALAILKLRDEGRLRSMRRPKPTSRK